MFSLGKKSPTPDKKASKSPTPAKKAPKTPTTAKKAPKTPTTAKKVPKSPTPPKKAPKSPTISEKDSRRNEPAKSPRANLKVPKATTEKPKEVTPIQARPSVTGRRAVTFNRRVEVADTFPRAMYNRRPGDETVTSYAALSFAANELQTFKRTDMLVANRCPCEVAQLQRPFREIKNRDGYYVNNFHQVTSYNVCSGVCAFKQPKLKATQSDLSSVSPITSTMVVVL
ncbi:hypothetical protein SARC_05070 [Sphaeroforma arctica JP610]|uniref:Uncharacterized protein n=1 Tax=Sphaeroforma arctica JP610 TaxID=667725 RepID=A0A0L0G1F6_9EUKA|nr:hypothetical protein SARC_05070 [Sphaeroforma arctica JP610]KNC82649.1 hypothetical protein SARC_05070 [Sphaeroforma arctica JP610]|eukprot:XP_014156551.1 hypothetical protein SARC_05070 [Sphaeroforma arctica JP610]